MTTEFIAKAKLPTSFGKFEVYAFKDGEKEHLAIVSGEVKNGIAIRVHSKCLTGDTFASKRCDCREQLEAAMISIGKNGGMIIYLDQEGRGIGLSNKIKAYELQDNGLDTVEANIELGYKDDMRNYDAAKYVLEYFKLKSIKLMTNNPEKIKEIRSNGIEITEIIPITTKATKENAKYLETKKKKMKHML
ncbi:MAG: GTP cyclohydrolase II [Candidatus Micrarchaeota archaeon]|nr:GTP cyclohydrolase II [Candidatus Micrarchaeota archaeon]